MIRCLIRSLLVRIGHYVDNVNVPADHFDQIADCEASDCKALSSLPCAILSPLRLRRFRPQLDLNAILPELAAMTYLPLGFEGLCTSFATIENRPRSPDDQAWLKQRLSHAAGGDL